MVGLWTLIALNFPCALPFPWPLGMNSSSSSYSKWRCQLRVQKQLSYSAPPHCHGAWPSVVLAVDTSSIRPSCSLQHCSRWSAVMMSVVLWLISAWTEWPALFCSVCVSCLIEVCVLLLQFSHGEGFDCLFIRVRDARCPLASADPLLLQACLPAYFLGSCSEVESTEGSGLCGLWDWPRHFPPCFDVSGGNFGAYWEYRGHLWRWPHWA